MFSKALKTFLVWRAKNISNRSFMLMLSMLVGFLAGITAWALKSGVFYMHDYFRGDLIFDAKNYRLIIYPFIGLSLTLALKQWVIKDYIPHNISSILHAISKRKSIMRLHKVYSSVLGAILTTGFGGSVGLESPIISSGSAIGSNLARFFRLDYKSITTLLGCGAAGAIAAIFNTPIAGIVFAVEVLLLDMNRFTLIPLLVASVTGAITTKLLFSSEILFNFNIDQAFLLPHVPHYLLLGILAGLVSYYFTKLFLAIEQFFADIEKRHYRLFIGAPALGMLIYLFPALYGEGFNVIKLMLNGQAQQVFTDSLFSPFQESLWVFGLFFLALILLKVIATSLTLGAGGIGGIFAPSLFTGAMLGFLYSWAKNLFGGHQLSTSNFALVGMGSLLGGVLQAPLTGIFLIAEITNGYELFIPLMLSTTAAYLTSKFLTDNSIITMQLAKRGELLTHHKDKAVLHFLRVKDLVETDFFPIHENAKLDGLIAAISISKRNIFPVISSEGMLLGIILLDDVREIMFNKDMYDTSVLNLMHTPPAQIDINDHMETVVQQFNQTGAWNLPVIENNHYLGFISKSKLFSAYRTQLIDLTEE